VVCRRYICLDIGRQRAFVIERAARRGMHQQKRENDDQEQCRDCPQQSAQRVSEQSVFPLRAPVLFGGAEAQVLTVMVIQYVVLPTFDLGLDEVFADVEIQRYDHMVGQ